VANAIQITLIGKPGCHLCDNARESLNAVIDGFLGSFPAERVEVTELNILDDAELALRHSEEIPVILINGRMHGYWHVEPARLRAALEEAANV
jgi:glutaredoxin